MIRSIHSPPERPGLAAVEAKQRKKPDCLVEVLDDKTNVDEAGGAGGMAGLLRSNDSLEIAGRRSREDHCRAAAGLSGRRCVGCRSCIDRI